MNFEDLISAEGTIPVELGGNFGNIVGNATFFKDTTNGKFDIKLSLSDEAGRFLIEALADKIPIALSFVCLPGNPSRSAMSSSENKKLTVPIPTPRLEMNPNAGPYITRALNLVHDYILGHHLPVIRDLSSVQMGVEWFNKIGENWQALVSTNMDESKFYVVSYYGPTHHAVVEEYKRLNKIEIDD